MNQFILNKTYYGFTLQKVEKISDVHSIAYLFYHEQSGARLLYLQNSDSNKVFNVAFKTPPSDDCGTPHILEHSVLCGSRKYKAKDPFNELAKGSLNTFLNAMTYADKTMYPIASCNEKDFHNLMDVYMDAVFYPRIYEKKEIFQQEGWRYLLNGDDSPLEVTGVVYNEMKGALADAESQLSGVIARSVFGKTTYGFESGGDPKAIPDLTYKQFLDFHRKYYHPSNAYFYLYGDMEPFACLQHIHEGYLAEFTQKNDLPVIEETECQHKGETLYESYPAAEEGEDGGTYLAYNLKVGKCTDPERIMALQILSYVLLESNASPIKNALVDAGICEETEGWFDSSTYEMVFSIVGKNADAEKAEEFAEIIETECKYLVEEGLPKDLLKGALRKYEFLLKEADYGTTPKGLVFCSALMKRWLHGEDPCDSLRLIEINRKLKKVSEDGYFEKLIESLFLQNEDKTFVVFTPEKGKNQKENKEFHLKMAEIKKNMTETDLAEIKADTKKLEMFQKQEDSAEVLAQIPLLEISEIDEKPNLTKYSVEKLPSGKPFLLVPMESNGIVYLKLHFDTSSVPQELLPYTGLLADLLGKLDTQQYTYQELPTAINQAFGGFSIHNNTYNKNADEYRSFLTAKAKLLKEDINAALKLIEEVLLHTRFDCVDHMKKIIKSAKIKGEYSLLNNSHYFAIYYSGSHLFPALQIDDMTSGIRYYRFLFEVDEQIEKNVAPIIEKLKETAALLFTEGNLEVAVGCEESDIAAVKEKLSALQFPKTELQPAVYMFEKEEAKVAFTSPGGVVYNVTSFDYHKKNIPYHGKFKVLKTIINLEYLWNKVRVQGGAYGGGSKFFQSGFCYCYSYRDPNLKETYDIYKDLARDIASFKADKREMTKYILGTINDQDQPKSNMDKLNAAIGKYYKNISDESLIQERLEILKTTTEDIRSCQDLLHLIDCKNICTIGDEQKINTNAEVFTRIEPLI